MSGAGALRRNQATRFVEPEGGRGDAAAPGDIRDGHQSCQWHHLLDLKLTLTCSLKPVNSGEASLHGLPARANLKGLRHGLAEEAIWLAHRYADCASR